VVFYIVLYCTMQCSYMLNSFPEPFHISNIPLPYLYLNSFLADLIKELAGFGCKVETFLQVTRFGHAYVLTCRSPAETFLILHFCSYPLFILYALLHTSMFFIFHTVFFTFLLIVLVIFLFPKNNEDSNTY
jgi:hypothetical protein